MKWIRKLFGMGAQGSKASSDAPAEELVGHDRESDEDGDQYFSDEPITSNIKIGSGERLTQRVSLRQSLGAAIPQASSSVCLARGEMEKLQFSR
ncbi:hypothetical protein ACFQDJ_07745 [Pseudomonas brassicacearum]